MDSKLLIFFGVTRSLGFFLVFSVGCGLLPSSITNRPLIISKSNKIMYEGNTRIRHFDPMYAKQVKCELTETVREIPISCL